MRCSARLSVLTVALAMRNDARGLATLLSPAFVLFGAWLLVTVVLSFDPGTSIRRLSPDDLRRRGHRRPDAAAEIAAGVDALVQRSRRWPCWRSAISEYCWRRDLSIHLATDPQEPGLAGNWRGAFGHKNRPPAIMVMVLFLGIYIIRSGLWISGAAIIAPGLAVPVVFGRKELADAVLCGAAADVGDVSRPLVLASRDHAADAAAVAEPAERRHRDVRGPCRDFQAAAAGFDLHRPHRHLGVCAAVAAGAIADRLRLRVLLGQQRHSKSAGRQGVGRLRRAQPQRLSRHRARHGRARACSCSSWCW